MWEQGHPEAAEAALANRLDVNERTAVLEAIALAYVTLACVAFDHRDLGRAHDLLAGLYALGVQRRQSRMIAPSLAERVRMEASLQRIPAPPRLRACTRSGSTDPPHLNNCD